MTDSPLLCGASAKAQIENENAVDQIDLISHLVNVYQIADLRESHVLELHKLAIQRIYACGGQYRSARDHVVITNSPHVVPEPALVPSYVRDALRWVNESTRPPLDRAAFILWRFNWDTPIPWRKRSYIESLGVSHRLHVRGNHVAGGAGHARSYLQPARRVHPGSKGCRRVSET